MALDPDSPLARLMAGPIRDGSVTWIGIRPVRRAPVSQMDQALLVAGTGVVGDHYRTRRNGPRQVTLIAEEDLAAMSSFLGAAVSPAQMRRNLVTCGVNLLALKDRRFRIGEALLEGSGDCAPCSFLEVSLGPGGFNAARGRGGITARVLEGGVVRVGDPVAAG